MSDYSQKLDGEYRQRARVSYIREHAHLMVHTAAQLGWGAPQDGDSDSLNRALAAEAVALAGAVFDALPQELGAEGSGAPAHPACDPDAEESPSLPEVPLLPAEPEVTTRATCSCSGKQPCSAECRRCVPERRQSAGPEEATHAGRVRQQRAVRFATLADCQISKDAAVIAAYHAHLASSGLQNCGACGARLVVGDGAEVSP